MRDSCYQITMPVLSQNKFFFLQNGKVSVIFSVMVKRLFKKYVPLLLCGAVVLSAQSYILPGEPKRLSQYIIDHWQVKDGLPQNSINAIVQTLDGYLWIGTYEGLVRFNGKTFTVFDRSNTPQLQSNRITSLCADTKGRLWIGSYGGGIVLYDQSGFHTPLRDTAVGMYINIGAMTIDPHDRLWVATERGVFCIRDSSVENVYPFSTFNNVFPLGIVSDRNGRIWCMVNGKIFIIESMRVRQFHVRHDVVFALLSPSTSGGVWIVEYQKGGARRVVKYNNDIDSMYSIPVPFSASGLLSLYEDSRGIVWCIIPNGIAVFNNGKWDYVQKGHNTDIEFVQVVVEDKEGNIWVGTNGNGLWRFRDGRFTPIGIAEGLVGENIWSVFEDSRHRKWIGTLGGNGWCYSIDPKGIHPITNRGRIYFCFLEDKKRNVWLAGESIVSADGRRRTLPPSFFSLVLALDSSGRVWLNPSHGGIYITTHEKIVDSLSLRNSAADVSIRTMKTDRDGSMWIGTQNGLFHYRNGRIIQYTTANGLPNNWIRSIYQDAEGVVWIATDGGLAKKVGEKFFSYTVQNGLHSNTIHIILEDDSSKLWMSSNKGVFVVRKSDLQLFDEQKIEHTPCVVYGEEDGMRSAEGNGSYQQGGWKMHDGTLWFATIKGVAVVDPNKLKTNMVVPPVVVEKIMCNGKELSSTTSIDVGEPVKDIIFHYAALTYRVHSRVQYRYKLEGYHNDWIEAGNQSRAEFTNLPPGDFVFRVIACNDDGVWNTTGASIAFTLPAPFWMTWWFRGMAALVVVVVIGGTIRFIELRKIRRRIEQLEREKALERERSRISKDMHDEVGANLTKIAILSELALRDATQAPAHLGRITETSREVIDSMSEIIWAINPKNDKLENLAAYLREYISETFELTTIRCVISFPESAPELSLAAEFRRNIFLTVKEAIHNVVKYSQATEVHAELHIANNTIAFLVRDNGVGFDVSTPSPFGNGLHNMKKRIEDIGGTFTIESSPGKGTTVEFVIPI